MKQELSFKRNGQKILGYLYLPEEKKEPYPLIIMSHGFRMNHEKVEIQAQLACQAGFAAYIFDFCGGSSKCKSDGLVSQMSVLTEAQDLETILSQVKEDPRIDKEHIFLMGESQGGFVSAYVAAQKPDEIVGLILFAPAFIIQDDARRRVEEQGFDDGNLYDIRGEKVGDVYFKDALSFDIYEQIATFSKPVLMIHGDKDLKVPVFYSEKALAAYENAELVILPDAGHSFYDDDALKASQLMLEFIRKQIN